MNPTDSIHRQTWDLIPWIVNKSASIEDRQRVRNHLETCADCRDELALQTRIHAGLNFSTAFDENHAGQSFAELIKQIDAGDEQAFASGSRGTSRITRATPPVRNRNRWMTGLAAAVVVQAMGLIALGTMLVDSRSSAGNPASYSTLSSHAEPASDATIRLVPSPTLSIGGLQSLLDAAGLQIVGSNSGATILALAPAQFSRADGEELTPQEKSQLTIESIARLRKGPGILLAEPILAPGRAQ